MNYQKIYNTLIERGLNRKLEGYTEVHHIIPKCLGGSDDCSNIVELTPEEHYVAHQLLVKIYPDNYKLIRAASMMIPQRPNNKMYGWLRRKFSEAQSFGQSGEGNSQYGTKWITNGIIEKKIPKNENLTEGWILGRLIKYQNDVKNDALRKEKELKKQKALDAKVEKLRQYHEIYINKGFAGLKEIGYPYSHESITWQFHRYLPEFKPQPRIKRGQSHRPSTVNGPGC